MKGTDMRLHPITKLQREHSNMQRVQMVLSMQLERLEHGEPADAVLLANVFYYLRKFPSVVHHPKEDLIFQKLLQAGAPLREEVAWLRAQHAELYALEDQLVELALRLPADEPGCRKRVLQLSRHYLTVQIEHVDTEERLLFPQALKLLKPRDWQEVRTRSTELEDPLFGERVAERYQYLYDYLLREAADSSLAVSGEEPHGPNTPTMTGKRAGGT